MLAGDFAMTISAHFDGQVFVPDDPVTLPVGRKVRVELIDAIDDDIDPPGTQGDEQRNDPESIARWIAEWRSIPAAHMAAEEETDWIEYRRQQNSLQESKMDALIESLNEPAR